MQTDYHSPAEAIGIYHVFDWQGGHALEELEAALRKQERTLRNAERFDVLMNLARGRLSSLPVRQAAVGFNKIQDGWLLNTVGARLMNDFTANEDGIVRYVSVGTDYTGPARNDNGLKREIIRKAPIAKKQTGDHHKFIIHLDFNEANSAETTIAAGTHTVSQFEVTSASGIGVGDALRVQLGAQYAYTFVKTIVGTTVTTADSEPLPSAPVAAAQVLVCTGEGGLYGNVAASATLGTGTNFSRARLRYPKTDAYAPMILGDIILVPA